MFQDARRTCPGFLGWVVGSAVAALFLIVPGSILADFIVAPGWDLFETRPGTQFMGIPFEGVPIGNFDFGGTVGVRDVGDNDTIVERLGPAIVGGSGQTDTVDIEIVALQLVSATPVDVGAGLDFHYVTLQEATPSTGTMSITFDNESGGTFDSFFNVNFDLRIGALNGPILMSDVLPMTSSDNPWQRTAPAGATQIEGVNYLLKGDGTTDQDFWPVGQIQHDAGGAGHHTVEGPEPGALSLLLIGALAGAPWLRRRRRSAA